MNSFAYNNPLVSIRYQLKRLIFAKEFGTLCVRLKKRRYDA